jgi:hypothetical protein
MFGLLTQILFGEEPELVIPIFGLSSLLPKLMRSDSYLLFGGLPIFNFNSHLETPARNLLPSIICARGCSGDILSAADVIECP